MTLAHLALRNALRDRARFFLTVLAVATAIVALVTLRSAEGSWQQAQDVARKDRLLTRHKVTFILPLPRRYVGEIRAARAASGGPLFVAATYSSWFGGRSPGDEKTFFPSMAVDAESFLDVYDEVLLSPEERRAFLGDRSGAIVGELLAKKMGWKVGDRVTLESGIYPAPEGRPWAFTIDGVYRAEARSVDRQGFYFHWERLDEELPPALRDQVGVIATRVSPGEDSARAASGLDALFADRDAPTLSQDERAFTRGFLGMVSAVLDLLGALSWVIAAIMGLVLANAVGMGVRERGAEYATLKAMGFRPRAVALVVLGEGLFVASAGGAVGAIASAALVGRGLARALEENLSAFFPVFRVEPSTLALSFACAAALGLAASAAPAARAARADVVGQLRRVA